jgi:hypothetical protein
MKTKTIDEITNEDLQNKTYQNWRDIQRKQLGESANLHFIFSGAILGFSISLLLKDDAVITFCTLFFLTTGMLFILFSIGTYILFMKNRLEDFQTTARGFLYGNDEKAVFKETLKIGERTWDYHFAQRATVYIGFTLIMIGILLFLLNNIHLSCHGK